MPDKELPKGGLPPRDRNADVPEHTNRGTLWIGGVIAACAVAALIMLGGSSNNTASNSLSTGSGVTTGAAPGASPKDMR